MPDTFKNLSTTQKVDLFKADLKNDKQLQVFKRIYKKYKGDWLAIKRKLRDEEEFSEVIDNLEFTFNLDEWSEGNNELISLFQNDNTTNTMRDIAKISKLEFISRVRNLAPVGESKKEFAVKLHRKLFNIEPTTMLINVIRDPKIPVLNNTIGEHVAKVLENHSDFNIKNTSIYSLINDKEVLKDISPENYEEVMKELKTLQRIAAISPDIDAIAELYNANLHSAMQISSMPKSHFRDLMSKSKLDDNLIEQIYSNAQMVRLRNEQTIIGLREARGTGIALIDKSLGVYNIDIKSNINEALEKHDLSWDLIFGDDDLYEYDESDTVYSPSAYFVDLLEYLRNNNHSSISGSQSKNISGTPLQKLFDRRPDLGHLELTSKNTNTVLPYIDLVNEIMESYVAYKCPKPFNVVDESSSELLAQPQNIEYTAYKKLKDEAVYPSALPYNQPVDVQRIYLKKLGTSRYELIKTFRKSNVNDKNTSELTRLKDEELDRAADAEYLGLCLEEYVILTKESFQPKALKQILDNKSYTDNEYRKSIGVKSVWEYYGFDNESEMLRDDGLASIEKEFLRRTGIEYKDLVELLKTRYINPTMPKGKSKYIMESLHCSYGFLIDYAREELLGASNNKTYLNNAKLDKTDIDLIKSSVLTIIKNYLKKNEKDIPESDINEWVDNHFIDIGKMIVIEKQSDNNSLDWAVLQHLNGSALTSGEYDRIHRFIRLWRKLGCSIDEVDQMIMSMKDSDINATLIHQLVAVKKLQDKTNLELVKLLSFWSDIGTAGEKSLYQQLFLTNNLKTYEIFKADDNGNYLTNKSIRLLDYVSVISAALNLSSDDIELIRNHLKMKDELSIENLSMLYRYRLISKVLGVRIPDLLNLMNLYKDVFKDAYSTLEFLEFIDKMNATEFTYQQLNYIINNLDDEKNPLEPTHQSVVQFSKTLYDGLNAIDEEHKDLEDVEQATSMFIRTKASVLVNLFGNTLFENYAPYRTSIGVI